MSRAQASIRSALVVAQLAVAFALLVGSGLAMKAFAAVAATPPGFNPENLVEAFVDLAAAKYDNDDKVIAFHRDALAKVVAQPGVRSAAVNTTLPMGGGEDSAPFAVEGKPPWAAGEAPLLGRNVVTPDYFKTMEIPLLRGRAFDDSDTSSGRMVVIVSQSTADRFFRGQDPIGQRIEWQSAKTWREIVGVVADVRHGGLDVQIAPEAYVPLAQRPARTVSLIVRTSSHLPHERVFDSRPLGGLIIGVERIASRKRPSGSSRSAARKRSASCRPASSTSESCRASACTFSQTKRSQHATTYAFTPVRGADWIDVGVTDRYDFGKDSTAAEHGAGRERW